LLSLNLSVARRKKQVSRRQDGIIGTFGDFVIYVTICALRDGSSQMSDTPRQPIFEESTVVNPVLGSYSQHVPKRERLSFFAVRTVLPTHQPCQPPPPCGPYNISGCPSSTAVDA
jgi:hypothetical protein